MNFWNNKKQIIQKNSEISIVKAENKQLKHEIDHLKKHIDFVEQQNKLLSRVTEITDRNELIVKTLPQKNCVYSIGIESKYNYKGQLQDAHFYFYISSEKSSSLRSLNHIWIEPQYRINKDLEYLDYIKITDFIGKKRGNGYGSLNLKTMLEYLRDNFGENITVKGWLSPEDEKDKENKSRRDHVYKKFGFEIIEDWAILENLSSLSN